MYSNKVLVLGDGLLGSELVKQTNWDYASRRKGNLDINELYSLPRTYDTIINCIANTDTYSNEKELHWKVNVEFVKQLINYCNHFNIKLIHISTDFVYANSTNDASETDIPVHANNWYSYSKLIADALIELDCENYLICRCGHKPHPFPYDEAWVDYTGNFDYVTVIADLIINLIKNDAEGLYNVGTELKNMYELAIKTKNVISTFKPDGAPDDISMDVNKIKRCLNI
jgi:dTDP-4-dehydrorhamnose reductase